MRSVWRGGVCDVGSWTNDFIETDSKQSESTCSFSGRSLLSPFTNHGSGTPQSRPSATLQSYFQQANFPLRPANRNYPYSIST